MKKTLLALSIATAGQLAADCNDCCEPCCVPQPKKCIDCECYTPKYYDLQCACDFFITADFLYWFGKETGLSYALKRETLPFLQLEEEEAIPFNAPTDVKWMEESWDPGVRVGIGANDVFCDGWDLYFYWSYFHTKKKQSTSINTTEQSLFSPWTIVAANNLFDFIIIGDTELDLSEVISAKWKMDFNTFDLELGRNYWLSSCFSMRPYMGVRGGWTKTRFATTDDTRSSVIGGEELEDFFFSEQARFKNKFWGVGLSGGFQPNWHLGCGFSLFGNADLALLWGCFDIDRTGNFSAEGGDFDMVLPLNFKTQSKFSAMQAILDLAAGLRYECTYCCDSYRLAIDLGWEHHIWFDHNHRTQFEHSFLGLEELSFVQLPVGYKEPYGNLVLAGLVVRARFDF